MVVVINDNICKLYLHQLSYLDNFFKSVMVFTEVVRPCGLIVLKEKLCLPDLTISKHPVSEDRNYSIPEDLKVRHPLFGSGEFGLIL